MGCSAGRGTLAQRLEGLDGEAAKALVAKELQKGLALNGTDAPLPEAVRRHVKAAGLEALLAAGAPICEEVLVALLARLRVGEDRAVVNVFLDHGMDVNTQDPSPDAETLLMAVIRSGDVATVEDLLNRGADVMKTDSKGNTPLHVAAARADEAIVDALLQRGAVVTNKNEDGHSAVMSARLASLAPNLRLSGAGGWASKEILAHKVFGKLDKRYLNAGEEVWRCPTSGDCWTASSPPPSFPRNHQVAARLSLAGDAFSLADAVEGAWLSGEAPPMKDQREVHPAIMQAIVKLVQVLQSELRAALEARDRAKLSAGLEMLRYAKVAQLPEEEAATRTLVSLELEEAIQSRSELELKQAILSAHQYDHRGSRLYKEALETLQQVMEEKRVEQMARQLADAAARGDLETLHGLLQAGHSSQAGLSLRSRPEFGEAEAALKKGVRQSLQRATHSGSRRQVRQACAEALQYGFSELPEYQRLVELQRQLCLQNLEDASQQRKEETLHERLKEFIEDPDLLDWGRKEAGFQTAIQVYKELLSLPPYFEDEQVLSKISQSYTVKREELKDQRLKEAFQELMDFTYRRVRTKDRRGDVPSRLIVEEAIVVQNLPNFVEYMRRREEIRKHCKASPPSTMLNDLHSRSVCKTFAKLPNSGKQFHSVWRDAHNLPVDPIDAEINEYYLFHGTRPEAANAITEGDFRLDLAGSNAGTLYGRGVYFSESTGKSDEYATEDSRGWCCMLVCRVTLGRILYTDEEYPNTNALVRHCTKGDNHSVLGDREQIRSTFREMIVFDTDQAYPEFLVWYSRQH
ncbi:unnamed protein product [Durusdinium trenchii]|uniref:Poly [ADP-ribose] polymerase n=1 Tax=Durusdinium trenchii TaxID=1381693 RepID=A0ABP0HN41_9DINO